VSEITRTSFVIDEPQLANFSEFGETLLPGNHKDRSVLTTSWWPKTRRLAWKVLIAVYTLVLERITVPAVSSPAWSMTSESITERWNR